MIILTNAFSINMLPREKVQPELIPLTNEQAISLAQRGVKNAIGHADTSAVVCNQLGIENNPQRLTVKLDNQTVLLVAQYVGPRLPEGTTVLPSGSKIEYWLVSTGGYSNQTYRIIVQSGLLD